jgi:hypothetical protein
VRAGAYRLEEFRGGVYGGYRFNFGDVAVGADAHLLHFPFPLTEVGLNVEKSVSQFRADDEYRPDRAVAWFRHNLQATSSLYWLPREFIDTYAAFQNNWLPDPRDPSRPSQQIEPQTMVGLRYYRETYVPYWDPEKGYRLDTNISVGMPVFGEEHWSGMAWAQASGVWSPPEDMGWFSDVKLAFRAMGGVGLPTDARLYTLGGGQLFRGFDARERQGSCLWIGSVEVRMPLKPQLDLDMFDRIIRIMNVNVAPFYDVGDIYLDGHSLGPVAHAVGVGLRFDVAFFRFLERATLRLDVARAINQDAATQYWFNLQQPF